MGTKGDKMTEASALNTAQVLERLSSIDGVSTKKMFGGHGLFHESKMFGIIDSKGGVFLKADESNMSFFNEAGSIQHSRMPYYSVTGNLFDNHERFLAVALTSISAAKS